MIPNPQPPIQGLLISAAGHTQQALLRRMRPWPPSSSQLFHVPGKEGLDSLEASILGSSSVLGDCLCCWGQDRILKN